LTRLPVRDAGYDTGGRAPSDIVDQMNRSEGMTPEVSLAYVSLSM
jgi:hypothetical protein